MMIVKGGLKSSLDLLRKSDLLRILPNLKDFGRRKGNNGRIGVIGGSEEYTGAPYYAAISTLYGVSKNLT
jgi:ATP-dependent NAD(P)H-hydrate dehydratase